MEITESQNPSIAQPVSIFNTTFTSNVVDAKLSGTAGGALYFRNHLKQNREVDLIIQENLFVNNAAQNGGRGGAVYSEGRGIHLRINKSQFQYNRAISSGDEHGSGGALALFGGTDSIIFGSIFLQNRALPYIENYLDDIDKFEENMTHDEYFSKDYNVKVRKTLRPHESQALSGRGGAVYASESSMFVSDCNFIENSCLSGSGDTGGCEGGALWLGPPMTTSETDDQYIYKRSVFESNIARAANPSQTNGIIQSENSEKGGATYIYRSRPNFEECNFISNKATAGMGGIFASGGAVDMTLSAVPENMNNNLRTNLKGVAFSSCNFRGNFVGSRHEQDVPKYLIAQSVVSSRTGRGGAVSAVASEVSFYNCTLENNMAGATNQSSMPAFAGAIFLDEVSRGMLNSSSLRDNIVVNGFGADIVIIDVDFPGVQNYKKSSPYADGIAASQKLLIQNSSFITSASSHLHHPVDSIILHDQIASILCLGGGVIIGEGNDFQQTTIVAAGKGSVLGQAIIFRQA